MVESESYGKNGVGKLVQRCLAASWKHGPQRIFITGITGNMTLTHPGYNDNKVTL